MKEGGASVEAPWLLFCPSYRAAIGVDTQSQTPQSGTLLALTHGVYVKSIGVVPGERMEKNMETTIMGLYRV